MNYTELVQNIQNWTENDDTEFTANIDTIIKMAEKRIYRDVDLPVTRKISTSLVTVAGTDTVDMPSDFVLSRWVAVTYDNEKHLLSKKDVSYIRDFWPDTSLRGRLRYYADLDNNTLIFAPRPDAVYSLEVSYMYYPTTIVTASTTWLGDNAEMTLLYACLLESSLFHKYDSDTVKKWSEVYKNGIDQLTREHMGTRRRTDETRGGENRG